MPYATLQDLIERFGERELVGLTDRHNQGVVDEAVVERALVDASGEVDGYVSAAGYPTPLAPVPRVIRAYCADIARYRLYDDAASEQVTKRYEAAVRFLRAVAKGDVKLGATPPESNTGQAEFEPGRNVFHGGGF